MKYAEKAPTNSAIWDEYSEHLASKHHIQCPISPFLMQIRCRSNVDFSWECGPNYNYMSLEFK